MSPLLSAAVALAVVAAVLLPFDLLALRRSRGFDGGMGTGYRVAMEVVFLGAFAAACLRAWLAR